MLALDFVLPDGEMVTVGSAMVDAPGPDLIGLIVGSEGTLGIATRAVVRILRRPETVQTFLAAFDSIGAGGAAVSAIIGAGIVPAAIEMMDALAIQAAEAAVNVGFPKADTILIVELDGPAPEVRDLSSVVLDIFRRLGASAIEVAENEPQRARIWRGRKAAFAAMGRVAPNYYVQDGVVPRTKLPEVLGRIRDLGIRSGLRIGNVFHAGDGNLHPLICYDGSVPGEADRAADVAGEILSYCVEAGGSITGEHGVGRDKRDSMPKMFTRDRSRRHARRARRRSTRAASAIPARSFRHRGCAVKCRARTGSTRLKRPAWRSGSDGGDGRRRARARTAGAGRLPPRRRCGRHRRHTAAMGGRAGHTGGHGAVLAWASMHGQPVVVRGGGTHIDWGRRADRRSPSSSARVRSTGSLDMNRGTSRCRSRPGISIAASESRTGPAWTVAAARRGHRIVHDWRRDRDE